ncbi:MAG: hypothetical protein U0R64_05485 [Candidatus Nanopelagicales bacterium]
MSLTGTYDGDADWSLAASQTGPCTARRDGQRSVGTVAYAQQVLTFSVSGAAQNVDLPDGVTATSLTAQVTNQCPTSGRSTGDLRLIVDAVGTISAGGSTDDYSGTVDVDPGHDGPHLRRHRERLFGPRTSR